ncbi:uncharacterized protein LOC115477759 [Microcaecilia unicolor]|uniref:Uncharacterized protein LOC115477759 n=1 Tax=Microcaecilia unicolor TaxID=1415580 RepID=A0A6P7YU21_9AMPH|nr:uncharacterized protein LOC115477759 [Microcaecilia unicolor]
MASYTEENVILGLLTEEPKLLPVLANKKCHKETMSQVTEYLVKRITAFKASVQKNCHVRDQLLSFYVKDVLGSIKDGTGTENMIDGFAFLKENMRNCLREKGVYKAISELDMLVLWIDAFDNPSPSTQEQESNRLMKEKMQEAMLCFGSYSTYNIDLVKLNEDVVSLKQHFDSSDSLASAEDNEGPVFIRLLKSWTEESDRRLLLSQIVSLYLEMFQKDLWKNSSVEGNIESLRVVLTQVKKDVLQASSERVKTLLDLQKLKMNDTRIQRKAILDLFCVLQELKAISSKQSLSTCVRRKRNKERKRRGNKN